MSGCNLHTLVFDREEAEHLFGPILTRADMARVGMQITRYNRKAHPFKVSLAFNRQEKIIQITARTQSQLEEFAAMLLACRGRKQKKFSLAVSGKMESGLTVELRLFLKNHLRALSGSLSVPRARMSIHSFWVPPPYGLFGRKAPDPAALKDLVQYLRQALETAGSHKAVFLTGESGIGKTSVLIKSCLEMAQKARPDSASAIPIYVPARSLDFRDKNGAIRWETIPGAQGKDWRILEKLFQAGRLILFLDGLDENPKCIEFTNAAVVSFWRQVSKNRCLISCRSCFWTAHVKPSFFNEIFLNGYSVIQLGAWQALQFQGLCSNLAFEFGKRGKWMESANLKRLARLQDFDPEPEAIQTPLSAWLSILGILRQTPDWEYPKRMNYLLDARIEWEVEKPGNVFNQDTAWGMLTQLARQAESSPGEIWNAAIRRYPFFEDKKADFFISLERLPFVKYDRLRGVFSLEPSIARILAYEQKAPWERFFPEALKLYQSPVLANL